MFGCTQCPVGNERCPRCSSRICSEHSLFRGDACAECELQYHERKRVRRSMMWFFVGAAVPWLVFVAVLDALPSWSARSGGTRAITTGVPMIDVLIMFTIAAWFTGRAAYAIHKHAERRAFMKRPLPVASSRS